MLFVPKRVRIGYCLPLFTTPELDSTDSVGTYLVAASTLRRAIHKLASANRGMTCVPFLASPR